MTVDVTIRRAEAADARELTAIAFAAKRHWGYPETWIELWAEELTIDGRYIDDNRVFLAADSVRTLGWCSVLERGGEYWLDYCWVRPDSAGRGIGRALVSRSFSTVAELQASALKVIADPNAVGFYHKLDFHRVGDCPSVPAGRRLPVLKANVIGGGNVHDDTG